CCSPCAPHSAGGPLPVQSACLRSWFIAGSPVIRIAQLSEHSTNIIFPVRNHSEEPQFTVGFGNCHRDLVGMDIQAHESYLFHKPAPFACGSAPSVTPANSVTRVNANQESVFFFQRQPRSINAVAHTD